MTAREQEILFESKSPSGVMEHLISPEIPGMPELNISVYVDEGLMRESGLIEIVKENISVVAHSPELETEDAEHYIGGYHVVARNPAKGEVRRVGVVVAKSLTGQMHCKELDSYSPAFGNPHKNDDILSGSVLTARKIGDSETEHQIVAHQEFGSMLHLPIDAKFDITYPITDQLEAIAAQAPKEARLWMGLSRKPFLIDNPDFNGPVNVVLSANSRGGVGVVEVQLPSFKAMVTIDDPQTGRLMIVKKPIFVPAKSNANNPMKNFHVGSSGPYEPRFMANIVRN
jgi:hypothetical protein